MIETVVSRPATSYSEALERARAFMALDDESILPFAYTRLLDHGERRPNAVVLIHGFTNHPGQYVKFAPMVFERGANVFVPRMPEHGDRNRMTNRLASLTAEAYLASAIEAVDIACGLGERVSVLGISTGGLLAAYCGQFRRDVHTAVPVSPVFAMMQLPYGVSTLLARIVRALPNFWLWWDPRIRERQHPKTAYPRYPTHALMQCLRIGDLIYAKAKDQAARADGIVTVVNRVDPAVNNAVTSDVVLEWRGNRRDGIAYDELRSLPENHDIIDPDNPLAHVDMVYPKLLEALGL